MKIGFFSDVHGNIHSFKSGIKIFENLGVKKFIFLGDVCGYYYNSIEIIEMLIKFDNLICILGNHDEIFKSMYLKPNFEVINEYSLKYGSSLKEFLTNASKNHYNFLANMSNFYKLTVDGLVFSLYHGGPEDLLNQRIFDNTDYSFTKDLQTDYIAFGHTHYRFLKKVGNKILFNPGSLGQPRDGHLPSILVFDTNDKSIKYYDINYDFNKVLYDISIRVNEPKYLIDVIYRTFGKSIS